MGEETKFRIERDSMGEVKIPSHVYWGAQTQRAIENFPISGFKIPREFIHALGLVKTAAAEANMDLGILDKTLGNAIIRVAKEIVDGAWDNQFPVDIFQTGSGTSTNMNANEVIANRSNEILGHGKGTRHPIHPNDHVNMGQSSNDVIPTCIHVAGALLLTNELIPALQNLERELEQKSTEFQHVIKLGRTHLQDATPVRMGQEFKGFASMINHGIRKIENSLQHLLELAIGGTAVGTGINSHLDFSRIVIKKLNKLTNMKFKNAENHFEAQSTKDAIVHASATLKTLSVSLIKIANDIRWMGSGPVGGLGELVIPAVQPGSSIMPGKINPVILESMVQVATQVIGYDASITLGGLSGNFELNVMMPLIAHNFLLSIKLLKNSVTVFVEKCLKGLKANTEHCQNMVENSYAIITALAPVIGYDKAAEIAHEAYRTGVPVKKIILQKNILSEEKLDKLLDPGSMT